MDKVREALEEAKNLLNALHEMDNKNTVHRIVGLIDDALASLAHPRPETWEEDIDSDEHHLAEARAWIDKFDERGGPGRAMDAYEDDAYHFASCLEDALSRLAAPKPKEQDELVYVVTHDEEDYHYVVGVYGSFELAQAAGEEDASELDEGDVATITISEMSIIRGEAAAPAPRPADELDLLDALQGTAEEHGKQFWERKEPPPVDQSEEIDTLIDYCLNIAGNYHDDEIDLGEARDMIGGALRSRLAREDESLKKALVWIETAQETLHPDRDIPCDDQAWHQLEHARADFYKFVSKPHKGVAK